MTGSYENPFREASYVRAKKEYEARKPVMQANRPELPKIAKLIVNAPDALDPHLVTELSKAGNKESFHNLLSTRTEASRLCAVLARIPVANDDGATWCNTSVEFAFLLGNANEHENENGNEHQTSSHNHIAEEMLRVRIPEFSDDLWVAAFWGRWIC
jgi:hypothetical protein